MRLEYIPVMLGVLVLFAAAGIIFDAASPGAARPFRERRRRQRAELNAAGEGLVGAGVACLGVSLIGNEVWRWTTIVVISGVVLILIGALMNKTYLREMLLFRGAARRGDAKDLPPNPELKLRIR